METPLTMFMLCWIDNKLVFVKKGNGIPTNCNVYFNTSSNIFRVATNKTIPSNNYWRDATHEEVPKEFLTTITLLNIDFTFS